MSVTGGQKSIMSDSNVKFGFKKTVAPNPLKNLKSKLLETEDEFQPESKDFVDSISGTFINGSAKKPKLEKAELVIPLISKNNWRPKLSNGRIDHHKGSPSIAAKPKAKDALTLEQQAVNEILESAKKGHECESAEFDSAIPLLLQNRIPDGFETDDNMDVSLRPEESTLDDYDRVPIEQFGLAMLRGMGWSKTGGIGLTNQKAVDMKEPQVRPKGLGLGAERPNKDKDAVPQSSGSKDDRDKLTLKVGAYVIVTKGSSKGNYGQVESFDEDNNRVIIKLAINSKMAAVSKFYIDLVSEREFHKKSKALRLGQI